VVVERVVELGLGRLLKYLGVPADLLELAVVHGTAAELVDGAMLGRERQPRARIAGYAGARPLFEGHDQRVLGQFLGQADISDHAGQPGDDPCGLDPPDRLDRPARFRLGHVS
jgi:hypothetical protein